MIMVIIGPGNGLQVCQVLLSFRIWLWKSHFCYWNFHEILGKILKFVLISQSFPHKNTELCVKFSKNTEISTICYWSEFPEVGSPGLVAYRQVPNIRRTLIGN